MKVGVQLLMYGDFFPFRGRQVENGDAGWGEESERALMPEASSGSNRERERER
jgi:hypothetical protein